MILHFKSDEHPDLEVIVYYYMVPDYELHRDSELFLNFTRPTGSFSEI